MLPFITVFPAVLRITELPVTFVLIVVDDANDEAIVSAPLVPSELTTTAPLLASFTFMTPDVEFADKLLALMAKAEVAEPMLPVELSKASVGAFIEALFPTEILPPAVVRAAELSAFTVVLALSAIPPEPLLVLMEIVEPDMVAAAIVMAVADFKIRGLAEDVLSWVTVNPAPESPRLFMFVSPVL
jgi:hypothetical protein